MRTIKEVFATQAQSLLIAPKFYRFRLFTSSNEKKSVVGMAYLKEGQNIYTLRLWTFLEAKFFLLPSKDDPTKYLLMSRERNRSTNHKGKYFWNIVGNAKVNSSRGIIELSFDLLDKNICMSIFPEESATPHGRPVPDEAFEAA